MHAPVSSVCVYLSWCACVRVCVFESSFVILCAHINATNSDATMVLLIKSLYMFYSDTRVPNVKFLNSD